MLVLDDLHWSDEASIQLLAALLRRGADAPVLLALAFRPGQAPARLMAALAVPSVRRIVLERLTEAQAAELLSASLSTAERMLLQGAAVAGEPFEPDLAAAVAKLPAADALGVLDALLALDLLRPTSVPRRFVFRHPLVRRAVYESAPAGWKLAAHARTADALAARGASPAERAHHVEQYAGQGAEAAIGVLLEAGTAVASRAPAAAARWFETTHRRGDEQQPAGDSGLPVVGAPAAHPGGEALRVLQG